MVKNSKIFHPVAGAGGQTLMQTRVVETNAGTTALFMLYFLFTCLILLQNFKKKEAVWSAFQIYIIQSITKQRKLRTIANTELFLKAKPLHFSEAGNLTSFPVLKGN